MFRSVAFQPFFIALNSQNTSGLIDLNPENEEIMAKMNKNMLYYYFCVDIRDFVFQRLDTKSNVAFANLPKFLCIKSYYPSLEFYFKVLKEIFGNFASNEIM